MERTGSQKALLVLSIIEIVFSALGILGGLAMILMGGAVAVTDPSSANLTANQQATAVSVLLVLSIVLIIAGIWGLLCGIFGIRAANDNQKIMIVWVFTLIEAIGCILAIIMAAVNNTFGREAMSLIVSMVVALLMFWIANNIKKEAGK